MKSGRNDPCPCGSGRKYKHCCGATRETVAPGPTAAELAVLAQAMGAQAHASVEAHARQLLQRYPQSGIVWKFLGISLALQDKPALEALAMAVRGLPADADAHFNYAHALRAQRQLGDARTHYARAAELRPDFGMAQLHLAATQKDLGQLDAAVRSYQRGVALVPASAAAHGNLGSVLHELGRLQEAVASYSKALALDATLAETHGNLGAALLTLGDPAQAVASLERALALDPNFALAHLNLGNALQALGRPDEAMACFRRSLQIEPRLAAAHTNLGNAQRELGHSDEALWSHRQALAIDPSLAVAHSNLATTLQERGQLDEAAASLRRALQLNPRSADLHANLAAVLHSQGRTAEADAAARQALQIDPALTSALALRAEVEADQGHFAEADALYRRATGVDPNFAAGWAGMAGLRRMTADDTSWLKEAQRVVEGRLPSRQEIPLRYAIGKYFDDVGDYPAAFASFQRANELTRQIAPRYDAQDWERRLADAQARYSTPRIADARDGAEQSDRPVFIVGMPRSGTSLVEQILASLPSVHGGGELPFWTRAVAAYESSAGDAQQRAHQRQALAREYLQTLADLSKDALRVTDKMPANFLWLGLIHSVFPNASILYVRRDPIDTCLSIYFQNFPSSHAYANDLGDLAHFYTMHVRFMEHWKSVLPKDALLEVPYEDLIESPESWSRQMLAFIGLPWDPRCLAFSGTERVVATRSRWQVRQALNKHSVQRWRNYEEFLGPLRNLLTNEQKANYIRAVDSASR